MGPALQQSMGARRQSAPYPRQLGAELALEPAPGSWHVPMSQLPLQQKTSPAHMAPSGWHASAELDDISSGAPQTLPLHKLLQQSSSRLHDSPSCLQLLDTLPDPPQMPPTHILVQQSPSPVHAAPYS